MHSTLVPTFRRKKETFRKLNRRQNIRPLSNNFCDHITSEFMPFSRAYKVRNEPLNWHHTQWIYDQRNDAIEMWQLIHTDDIISYGKIDIDNLQSIFMAKKKVKILENDFCEVLNTHSNHISFLTQIMRARQLAPWRKSATNEKFYFGTDNNFFDFSPWRPREIFPESTYDSRSRRNCFLDHKH